MKEILSILDILKSDTPRVLATLGKVEGSSYRRSGARLLWSPKEPRIGSISGGCLEDDLIERARTVIESGRPETVVYDTTSENDLVWGVGLGCNGVVSVLLEPLAALPPTWQLLKDAWAAREDVVFLTVIRARSPELLGTKYARSRNGRTVSVGMTLPGAEALAETRLAAGTSAVVPIQTHDGTVEVFCEYLPPPIQLSIFGAGDDARPLARLAKELGWLVNVSDPRPAYATADRFPGAHRVNVITPHSLPELGLDRRSAAVVMTHHYKHDVPLLRATLESDASYVGLLGPKKRAQKILHELSSQGYSPSAERLQALHAPVGLDLGGSSPEAVALSILAEIKATISGRDGRPLRERNRPIHE